MKKLVFILIALLLFPTTVAAAENIFTSDIEPKASYVFHLTGSSINQTAYGGNCTLLGKGKGSIQIILQKQNDYSKAWYTYDGQNYIRGFSDKSVFAYSKEYTLPKGKFRCKAIITATLNGISDSRTVYSPELTIY